MSYHNLQLRAGDRVVPTPEFLRGPALNNSRRLRDTLDRKGFATVKWTNAFEFTLNEDESHQTYVNNTRYWKFYTAATASLPRGVVNHTDDPEWQSPKKDSWTVPGQTKLRVQPLSRFFTGQQVRVKATGTVHTVDRVVRGRFYTLWGCSSNALFMEHMIERK